MRTALISEADRAPASRFLQIILARVSETQMQHSLWSHMMHTNNECAYNMNPVTVRV